MKLDQSDSDLSSRDQLSQRRRPRPHCSQPGTLGEQVQAVNLYHRVPSRLKRNAAEEEHVWRVCRSLSMTHAREE